MGHKIFVSYKYADTNVAALPGQVFASARDYVTALEHKLDRTSQIYKGESDGEDLSYLTEEQIWAKLRDRIYDTSVTIVFISRGMKEPKPEWWQWIPWEISYSLKEIPRGDRVSRTNAFLRSFFQMPMGRHSTARSVSTMSIGTGGETATSLVGRRRSAVRWTTTPRT